MYQVPRVARLSTKNIIIYCKMTYFRWDFISRFCHIVSLQQSKIHVFGRVAIENHLNIFIFVGCIFPRENKTHTKISDFTVVLKVP
jgi:hypothetical protein